jgi:hydrogenase nickel incorporation protein HypB
MNKTRIVRVRESILSRNRIEAADLRQRLTAAGTTMVNVMASPGSGKTSLILKTIEEVRERWRIAVVEADIDSTVDADKMIAAGVPAVQIQTGGFCHVDANMADEALAELDATIDLVFLENVGNLICTAQHDTGAHINIAILSVPEGDDKPLKYPVMFREVDAVIINKTDFLSMTDFDIAAARERIRVLNPSALVFEVSCRTGEGLESWITWIADQIGHTTES